jgi:hypothetical protein
MSASRHGGGCLGEVVIRLRDRGPEPAWHEDRELYGPWYRFEAEPAAAPVVRALGMTPWEAVHRLVSRWVLEVWREARGVGARHSMTDAALAALVLTGDGQAFAELAHRYREMIGFTTRNPAEGQEIDDERQEALMALLEACRLYNAARGSFSAIATVRVRSRVWNARPRARSGRNRILTDALRLERRAVDEDDSDATLADTIADREGTDPARVIELREELRERVIGRREDCRAKRRAHHMATYTPHPRERRGRDDPAAALALVAEGKTTRQAGAAVGVSSMTVSRWSRRFREG